jgi:uncharacterized membrane protein HdeD (DUF308 family)
MSNAPAAKDPEVLSYLALRKAVGWVALGLPFALVIPWAVLGNPLPTSISAYYYTGMRNLFVGSLCAIGMFNMCCRGYDWQDVAAGVFSAMCAIGVAFFPTSPTEGATPHQRHIGNAHFIFAALLFLTLAYFCFFLFTNTAEKGKETRKKLHRNRVYRICGGVILASIALIVLFKLTDHPYLVGGLGAMFCFETTALLAFGVAWLVKGETFAFVRDVPSQGQ